MNIKAIIGLGNPGPKYHYNRHNIGFRVVDALAEQYRCSWQEKGPMELAEITVNGHTMLLIKPTTFMNSSGKVIPFLQKKGIKPENILVIHDELELPFGTIKLKTGGSAKGHNGLKSIIEQCGPEFVRLRFGIGRPEQREMVPNYVLQDFDDSSSGELERLVAKAAALAIEGDSSGKSSRDGSES